MLPIHGHIRLPGYHPAGAGINPHGRRGHFGQSLSEEHRLHGVNAQVSAAKSMPFETLPRWSVGRLVALACQYAVACTGIVSQLSYHPTHVFASAFSQAGGQHS
jgi:hypothetical protein